MEKSLEFTTKNQGMHINPNIIHQIKNQANENLEFLVFFPPHSHGDKIIKNEKINNQ